MRTPVTLTVRPDRVQLAGRGKGTGFVDIARPYEAIDDLPSAITSAIRELRRRRVRVDIRLERPLVQFRTVTGFPPVGRRRLVQLVADRVGAIFRRGEDPLVVDARWTTRRRQEAVAVAASETALSTVVSGVIEAGATVAAVAPAGRENRRLSLLPPASRRWLRRRHRRVFLSSLLVAAASWTIAGGVYMWDLEADHRALTDEVHALETPVERLVTTRRQVGEFAAMVGVLQDDIRRRGWALAAIESVTASLPDSAFLSRLIVSSERRYEITGLARSSDSALASVRSHWSSDTVRMSEPQPETVDLEAGAWEAFELVVIGRPEGAHE